MNIIYFTVLLFLSVFSIANAQVPTHTCPCMVDCESVNNVETNYPSQYLRNYLKEKNWIITKYTDGRYYYHNLKTRKDQWEWPEDAPYLCIISYTSHTPNTSETNNESNKTHHTETDIYTYGNINANAF